MSDEVLKPVGILLLGLEEPELPACFPRSLGNLPATLQQPLQEPPRALTALSELHVK